jgi:hypothetical protein
MAIITSLPYATPDSKLGLDVHNTGQQTEYVDVYFYVSALLTAPLSVSPYAGADAVIPDERQAFRASWDPPAWARSAAVTLSAEAYFGPDVIEVSTTGVVV